MLNISKEYTDNLTNSLFNIISRKSNVDTSTMNELELELFGVRFGLTFIVFIKGRKYHIYAFTSVEEAKYVYDNIDKIEYLYCSEYNWDSIVGNIYDFVLTRYKFVCYSFEHLCAVHEYKTFIGRTEVLPTLDMITKQIERKN